MEEMGIHECREQIVGRADGVEITIEMKIDFRAGLDLRKSSARSATFHSEHGAERRLTRSNNDPFSDMRKPLRQADGSDGFAFAGGGRGRGGDDDKFAAAFEGGIGKNLEPDLAAVRADLLEIFIGKIEFACYRLNREKSS